MTDPCNTPASFFLECIGYTGSPEFWLCLVFNIFSYRLNFKVFFVSLKMQHSV